MSVMAKSFDAGPDMVMVKDREKPLGRRSVTRKGRIWFGVFREKGECKKRMDVRKGWM